MTKTEQALPRIRGLYLDEPKLVFADNREHVDPKAGIARFGPRSFSPARRHPQSVKIGFIGTAETMTSTRQWLTENAAGRLGTDRHPDFPGFMQDRGFFTDLTFDPDWCAQLFQSEVLRILSVKKSRDRFESLEGLLDEKLHLLAQKDSPPEYILLALPDELYGKCRVTAYVDKTLGRVQRDLRRAFKAKAMKYRIPTQLIRQQTVDGREEDTPSKVAWNFSTGLYFKAGGSP